MPASRKAAFILAAGLALMIPITASARESRAEWKDVLRSFDNPITRVVQAIRRVIARLDEPQAPPPVITKPDEPQAPPPVTNRLDEPQAPPPRG
jgi:hypothetical protein